MKFLNEVLLGVVGIFLTTFMLALNLLINTIAILAMAIVELVSAYVTLLSFALSQYRHDLGFRDPVPASKE